MRFRFPMSFRINGALLVAATIFCVFAAGGLSAVPRADTDKFDWHLPKGFPEPLVPADNPMTAAKVELGR